MLSSAARALLSMGGGRALPLLHAGRSLAPAAAGLQSRCYAALRYTEQHEWLCGDTGKVGLSEHAQEKLGDIVYVQLPDVGDQLERGDDCAAVESVKAAADVYAPVDGEVLEVNEELHDEPQLINTNPMDEGWIFRLKLADKSQLASLMDESDYDKFVQKEIDEE